jgi:hypothetical protein
MKLKNHSNIIKFALLAGLALATPAHAAVDAQDLLRKADRARGGLSDGLEWNLAIVSKDSDGQNRFEYKVQVKGSNVLAKCLAPARSKGDTYLFLDRTLWVHRSELRKPLSLSSRQRLSGQAANGDIATTNYSRDYTAKLLGEEKIGAVKTWKLSLKAKGADLTYDQITYWISQDKFLGVQAEFLTLDGVPFKRAKFEYGNSIAAGGQKIPFVSKMTINDVKTPALSSELTYDHISSAKIDDQIYNVNNLSK